MRLLKKMGICFVSVVIAGAMLAGCGANNEIIRFASSDMKQAVNDRFTQNLSKLEELYVAGWVTDEYYEQVKENLEENRKTVEKEMEKFVDTDEVSVQALQDSWIFNSISYIHPFSESGEYSGYETPAIDIYNGEEGGNTDSSDIQYLHGDVSEGANGNGNSECWSFDASLDTYYTQTGNTKLQALSAYEINVLSNYIKYKAYGNNADGSKTVKVTDYWEQVVKNGRTVTEPITIITEQSGNIMGEAFNAEVWVLRPDLDANTLGAATTDGDSAATTGLANDYSLDGVIELVAQKFNGMSNDEISANELSALDNYFTRALDSNGNALKLLDLDGNDNSAYKIVDVSKPNLDNPQNPLNSLGYDLVIKQYNRAIATLQFVEFSQTNINKLQALLGNGGTKYYLVKVLNSNGGYTKRAYLVEYPVYYVSGFKYNSNNTITAEFERSNLSINIRTKTLTKYYSQGDAEILSYGKIIQSSDGELYPLNGSLSPSANGKSSFIVRGVTEESVAYKDFSGESISLDGRKTAVARIILRDYLEAVYAPDFINSESLVTFGRKLRLNYSASNWVTNTADSITSTYGYTQYDLTWNTTDSILKFVDMDGNDLDLTKLNYTKLADIEGLSNDIVYQLPQVGQSSGDEVRAAQNSSGTKKVGDLRTVVASSVSTGTFPGKYIGKSTDYSGQYDLTSLVSSESHTNSMKDNQLFYVIALNTDLFETNLFSSWINSGSTLNSLEWWNNWLSANKYIYTIGHQDLNTYISGNYKYELGESGILVLDLDTIAKIQKEFRQDNAMEQNRFIRTVMVVLGWALTSLASLLLLGWVFDTNIGMGINILEKITFGHWVAVKFADDLPDTTNDNVRYMGFKEIVVAAVVLIVVGILLIRLNMYDIILWLIKVFGGIAKEIGKLITH